MADCRNGAMTLMESAAAAKLIKFPSAANVIRIACFISVVLAAGIAIAYFVGSLTMDKDYASDLVTLCKFLTLCVVCLIICLVPIGVFAFQRGRHKFRDLRRQVVAGRAFICSPDSRQWVPWVENTWGPDDQRFVCRFSARLALGDCALTTLAMLSLNYLTSKFLPWTNCVLIGVLAGLMVATLQVWIYYWSRGLMYQKLMADEYPLVLGPSSFYFAGRLVQGSISSSTFVKMTTGSGWVFSFRYGATCTNSIFTAPVGEEVVAEAMAFVYRHASFYRPVDLPGIDLPVAVEETEMVAEVGLEVGEP